MLEWLEDALMGENVSFEVTPRQRQDAKSGIYTIPREVTSSKDSYADRHFAPCWRRSGPLVSRWCLLGKGAWRNPRPARTASMSEQEDHKGFRLGHTDGSFPLVMTRQQPLGPGLRPFTVSKWWWVSGLGQRRMAHIS